MERRDGPGTLTHTASPTPQHPPAPPTPNRRHIPPRFSRLLRASVCIKGLPNPAIQTHPHSLATDLEEQEEYPLPPPSVIPFSSHTTDTTDQLKPKMMRKPGDWDCRSCQHLNFSRRDLCQQCGEPRLGDRSEYTSFGVGAGGGTSAFGFRVCDVRPGDWYCSCGYHNFASRANCLKCGGFRNESATGFEGGDAAQPRVYGRVGWKSGDWICSRSGCNVHNYASRTECFRCHAPRDSGTD